MDDPKGTHSDYYASYGYNPNAEIIEASSGDYRATRKLFLHGPKYKNWKTFHWQYDNNSSIESGISQKRGTGRAWDGDNTLFLNDEVGKTTRASWMEIKDNWIMNFKIETENYGHFDLTTFEKQGTEHTHEFKGDLYQTFVDAGREEDLIQGTATSGTWVSIVLRGGDELGIDIEGNVNDVGDFFIRLLGEDGQTYTWANTAPNDECWITLLGYKTVNENLAPETETIEGSMFGGSIVDDKDAVFGPEDVPAGYVYKQRYTSLDAALEAKNGNPFTNFDVGGGRDYHSETERIGNQLIVRAKDRVNLLGGIDEFDELYIQVANGWQVQWRCRFIFDNGFSDIGEQAQYKQDIDEEFTIVMEGNDSLNVMFWREKIHIFSLMLDQNEQFTRPLTSKEVSSIFDFQYEADFRLEFLAASEIVPQEKSEVVPIYGCTDSTALNYNQAANIDDGTCILQCPTGTHWDEGSQTCVPLDEITEEVHEHEGVYHQHEDGNLAHEHEDFPPIDDDDEDDSTVIVEEDSTNWLGIGLIVLVLAFGFFVILRRKNTDFVQEGGESSGE